MRTRMGPIGSSGKTDRQLAINIAVRGAKASRLSVPGVATPITSTVERMNVATPRVEPRPARGLHLGQSLRYATDDISVGMPVPLPPGTTTGRAPRGGQTP
jgi:hypothetical protein